MGPERLRVVIAAVVSIALLVLTAFVLDWFVIRVGPEATYSFSLHAGRVCGINTHGCQHLPLPSGDMYTRSAPMTVWGSVAIAVLVAVQACARLVTGGASNRLTKIGCLAAVSMLGSAFFQGYVFALDMPRTDALAIIDITVERTWAPLLMVVGHAIAVVSLYYSAHESSAHDGAGEYKPIVIDGKGKPAVPFQHPTMPTPKPAAPLQDARTRGKVRFAAASADLSRAGIDAQREDDTPVLVAWRDITRVMARRLPAASPYDGATAVDVVSKGGATIRIVPWTRLTGESFDTDTDARARADPARHVAVPDRDDRPGHDSLSDRIRARLPAPRCGRAGRTRRRDRLAIVYRQSMLNVFWHAIDVSSHSLSSWSSEQSM